MNQNSNLIIHPSLTHRPHNPPFGGARGVACRWVFGQWNQVSGVCKLTTYTLLLWAPFLIHLHISSSVWKVVICKIQDMNFHSVRIKFTERLPFPAMSVWLCHHQRIHHSFHSCPLYRSTSCNQRRRTILRPFVLPLQFNAPDVAVQKRGDYWLKSPPPTRVS